MPQKVIKVIMLYIIMQGIFLILNYCEATTGKINFSVSSNTGKIGDEVVIEINLNNDATFASANLVLNYKAEHLEYVSHTKGQVLNSGAMSIVKNYSAVGKIAIGYVSDPTNVNSIIQSGNILKAVFKIKNCSVKETNFELECTSLKDNTGTEISSSISNGKIKTMNSNNAMVQTTIPKAGLFDKSLFIITYLILTSITIILYKKNKLMKDIN